MAPVDREYWQFLDSLTSAEGVEPLRARVMEALAHVGFRAAYFVAPVTADPRNGRQLMNLGFPESWERRYRDEFVLVDPLPSIGMGRSHAFRWSEVSSMTNLSRAATRYVRLMVRFWSRDGVGVGCFGPQAQCGFMGVSRADSSEALSDMNLLRVQMIGQLSFQRYCELVRPDDPLSPGLSRREMEVMQWIGRGKSNAVIADILGIRKSSVDIYVKRIFAKLGVADRTTASVRALTLGLIGGNAEPSPAIRGQDLESAGA